MNLLHRLMLLLSMVSCASVAAEADRRQAIAEQMRDIVFVTGQFQQQRTLAALPAALESRGEFSYRRGEEIRWRTVAPVQSELRIRPDGLTVVDAEGAREPGTDALSGLLYSLFSADLDRLSALFTIAVTGNGEQWKMALKPHQRRLAEHLESIVMTGGKFTETVTIELANGDRTAIELSVEQLRRGDD